MKISRAALALTAFILGGATAEVIDWVSTPILGTQAPPVASTRTGHVEFFPRSSDSPAPPFYRVGSDLICDDIVLSGVGYTLDDRLYLASFVGRDAHTVSGMTFAPLCTLSSADLEVPND